MNKLQYIVMFLLFSALLYPKEKISVVDFSGNKVSLTKEAQNIVCIHPIFTYMTWRLAQAKLRSVDKVFQRQYLSESSPLVFNVNDLKKLKSLPVTGVFFDGVDPEQILKLNTDLLVTISKDPNKNKLKEQLKIPVLILSKDTLDDYEKSFRILGEIISIDNDGGKLADYWKSTIDSVKKENEKLKTDEKLKVFYTGTGSILETVGAKTIMSSIINIAGGKNVSDELTGNLTNEHIKISMDNVLVWNPDIIFVQNEAQKNEILSDPVWKIINAVKNNRIYVQLKYARMDGVTAVIAMLWTQYKIKAPDDPKMKSNFQRSMKEFYELFYNYNLTEEQLKELQN